MLNRSASLAMSTSVLKALPGKFDIKRHSPKILYLSIQQNPNSRLEAADLQMPAKARSYVCKCCGSGILRHSVFCKEGNVILVLYILSKGGREKYNSCQFMFHKRYIMSQLYEPVYVKL